MQTNPSQDIQNLTVQLTQLVEKVSSGADKASIVQELQSALETLRAVAIHDGLTGALNRRGLLQKLDAELDRAKRTGHSFSFAVIAVDKFQGLSEQFGSAIGDQVLKSLAQASLKLLRTLDSFGRISDNEFAIILAGTWLTDSGKAITRLTAAVSAVDWASIVPAWTLSFSTGLTTNAHGDTSEEMIRRASEALALAKAKGPGSSAQLEQALPDFDPNML
ncbi:MAG: GGDEF domain-containing protein [Pseudomonadota bacterium]